MINGAPGTNSKPVWWIMGIIASFFVLLVGTVVNQQVNAVHQIINRLDSLDRRLSMVEGDARENSAHKREVERRLGQIELDTRETRDKIRKLY